MRFNQALRWISAAAFLAVAGQPVLADRAPTPEERSRIEAVLRQQGFTRWDDIEFDDDGPAWEVDDAVGTDGRSFDLKLDPNNLSIIKRDPD